MSVAFNRAVGRLKNSRVFPQDRCCKVKGPAGYFRESTCAAREEKGISLSRLSPVSLSAFILTPGLSFDRSRAHLT